MNAARTYALARASTILAWLVVGMTVAGSASRAAESVFSTLPGTPEGVAQLSVNGVGAWNYAAQQFNTGFNNELTSVTLGLQRSIGATGSSTFSVELWTNSLVGGTASPGSLVATIASASTSLISTSGTNLSFPTSITGLTKFSDYWIVFNALDITTGQALWAYTAYDSGPGVAGTQFMKVNDGPGWAPDYGNYRAVMEVQAVPEPATLVLAAAGIFGITEAARRRRRRLRGRLGGRA